MEPMQDEKNQGEGSSGRPGKPEGGVQRWYFYAIIAVVLGIILLPSLLPSDSADEITWNEFRTALEAGEIEEATYANPTGRIDGEFTDGEPFQTVGPNPLSDADNDLLSANDIVTFEPPRTPGFLESWAPLLLSLIHI